MLEAISMLKNSVEVFMHKNVLVIIKTDKNKQICDVQPRIGQLHTTYQGRPLLTAIGSLEEKFEETLNQMPEEEIRYLSSGNEERAKEFNLKIKQK